VANTFIVIIYSESNNYNKNKIMSDGSKRNRIKYNHSKTAKQLSHISVNEAVQ